MISGKEFFINLLTPGCRGARTKDIQFARNYTAEHFPDSNDVDFIMNEVNMRINKKTSKKIEAADE